MDGNLKSIINMRQLNERKTSVRIPIELNELVKYYAVKFHVSQSEFIRDSIIKQIDRMKF